MQKHIMAVCLTWPDGKLTSQAAAWLFNRFPPQNIRFACFGPGVDYARNHIVKRIFLPSNFPKLLMIDNDMRPDARADLIFKAEGDIIGALYDANNPAANADPDVVHLGLVLIRREVFLEIEPPWFEMNYDKEKARIISCECASFCRKAKEKGFKITKAGYCPHTPISRLLRLAPI